MTTPPPNGSNSGHRRRPRPRRLAAGLVALALATALGVLVAAAIRQSGRVVDTRVIPAPTPPPLTAAALAGPPVDSAAALRSGRGRPAPGGGGPTFVPPGAQVPTGAMPGAPLPAGAAALAAPPPTARPRPTPTPPLSETVACRKGVYFDVKPASALVTVNGEPVGEARQWAEEDEPLELQQSGVYYLRLSCPGCRAHWIRITVDPEADDKIVKVKARLTD